MSNMGLYKFIVLCVTINSVLCQYDASWDSLDNRTIPEWYDQAKIGIFLHWGVYSVPSYGDEWFWHNWVYGNEGTVAFMQNNYAPDWTYQDFGPQFTAEFYDPDSWADLFERSGAKYVVLTSKHHEGYTLWPSRYSYSWNAMDVGPHRDVLGDLSRSVKAKGLHFGLYHSLLEWFHPLYINDGQNEWQTTEFVDYKIMPEMKELVVAYEPEVIWSDGNWEAPDTYWKATEFLAWLYNESPVKDTVVSNDRWGTDTMCVHGDFYSCADRYNPGVLLPHKWENAMTIDRYSWGYRRNAQIADILSMDELIETVTSTVSCGGNILINVGPTKEGTIIPIFQERLLQLGEWLSINGEAIYESTPWSVQNDTLTPGVWYTVKEPAVYAIALDWPENNVLNLGSAIGLFEPGAQATLLGNGGELEWSVVADYVAVTLPDLSTVQSQWAWTVKIVPPN